MKQSKSSEEYRQNKIETYLDEIRNENYDNSFPDTARWLRNVNENLSTKSERNFSRMKNYFYSNKLRFAYAFLFLAVLIAACNYPVTQEEIAGDIISWTISNSDQDVRAKVESLEFVKFGQTTIDVRPKGGKDIVEYKVVIPKDMHRDIDAYKNSLMSIGGINDLKVISLNETVKRPVYSALLNDLFKIDINATNMNDEELASEIKLQLKNAGLENVEVGFERNSDGVRKVKLNIPEQELGKEGGFDMTIKDGDNVNRIKEFRKTKEDGADRFAGKTDEEVKNMVREDIGDPGLKDDEIQIERIDGKVRVKVKKQKDGETIEERNMELK